MTRLSVCRPSNAQAIARRPGAASYLVLDADGLAGKVREQSVAMMVERLPRASRLDPAELPFAAAVVGGDILRSIPRGLAVDETMKLVPGVKVDNQAEGETLVRAALADAGIGIRALEPIPPSMEDVFVGLIEGEERAAA